MSRFDNLINTILEQAGLAEASTPSPVQYTLNPEVDSSKLSTSYDQAIANFLETKPATVEEIKEIITRSLADSNDESTTPEDIFRELVDKNIIVPASTEAPIEDNEPDANDLAKEPEVDVNEPVTVPPEAEEEDDGIDGKDSSVPPPEEDEADTFNDTPVKGHLDDFSDIDNINHEDEDDDTPTSELIKKDSEKQAKKQDQLKKLTRFLFKKRGKTEQEADEYFDRLNKAGKI